MKNFEKIEKEKDPWLGIRNTYKIPENLNLDAEHEAYLEWLKQKHLPVLDKNKNIERKSFPDWLTNRGLAEKKLLKFIYRGNGQSPPKILFECVAKDIIEADEKYQEATGKDPEKQKYVGREIKSIG